jgi:diguanylate cyclase (GGDEF)-like protein
VPTRANEKITLKYLILLIFIFLAGFTILVALHFYFQLNILDKLDRKTDSIKAKITIAEYIANDITQIRSNFFELSSTTSNKMGIRLIKNKIEQKIKDIENALKILEHGGVLEKEIALNVPGHSCTHRKISFNVEKPQEYISLEAIDIYPKLISLRQLVDKLENMLKTRNQYQKEKNPKLLKIARKIRRINKSASPFFNRMRENISRLIFEETKELDQLNKDIKKQKKFYNNLELAVVSSIIFIVLLLGQIVARQILKFNKKLQTQLYKDPLTNLENRFALLEHIRRSRVPVVILIDIDSFKTINELYGTEIGNEILIRFSKILNNFSQKKGFDLFRIGADEFVMFDDTAHLDIKRYKQDALELFEIVKENPIYIKNINETIEIDITVGISFEKNGTLDKADIALNSAKTDKKNFAIYSVSIDPTKKLKNIIIWKKEIKDAIEEDRFIPFLQPIVDKNQKIVKYESLMRMKKTKTIFIPPYEFLDIAIQSKQYHQISKIIINKSIDVFKNKNYEFSINLNYLDIANKNFHKELKNMIKKYDIKNRIIFEITESEDIKNFQIVKDFVKKFKKEGVRFAIDDFGSGYSNFYNILEIAPDFLKIDGSLIENIDSDKNSYELVKAISHFAKELNIKTIAEFVHSKKIFDIVFALDIDYFQGYYFGKPLHPNNIKPLDK